MLLARVQDEGERHDVWVGDAVARMLRAFAG
jgi:hypothetical protein